MKAPLCDRLSLKVAKAGTLGQHLSLSAAALLWALFKTTWSRALTGVKEPQKRLARQGERSEKQLSGLVAEFWDGWAVR